MNLQQKVCLWLGIMIFSLTALCPPWLDEWNFDDIHRKIGLGFHPVWHDLESSGASVRPDFSRLVLEWIAIVAVTAALLLTLRGQRNMRLPKLRVSSYLGLSFITFATGMLIYFLVFDPRRETVARNMETQVSAGVPKVPEFEIVPPTSFPSASELVAAQARLHGYSGLPIQLGEPHPVQLQVRRVNVFTGRQFK